MNFPDNVKIIINSLKISEKDFLGKGAESYVFAYEVNKIVKIYNAPFTNTKYLESLKVFYEQLDVYKAPIDFPKIYEIKVANKIVYTIERRLFGDIYTSVLPNLDTHHRHKLLKNFLNTSRVLSDMHPLETQFGNLMECEGKINSDSWWDFISKKIDFHIEPIKDKAIAEVKDFENKVIKFKNFISELPEPHQALVHGDYYFTNILLSVDLSVSSLLDFSPHTVVGDHQMDIAGAMLFLEFDKLFDEDDIEFIHHEAEKITARNFDIYLTIYRMFYSIYFFNSYEFNTKLYRWCKNNLNNKKYWKDLI
ncbi:MAG: fructosamine kinase family protein [bacterium]